MGLLLSFSFGLAVVSPLTVPTERNHGTVDNAAFPADENLAATRPLESLSNDQ